MAFPDSDFEAAIAQLEQDLMALKERYQEVCEATTQIETLKAQQTEITEQSPETQRQESLKTELNLLQEEIEKLELKLESNLLNWQEPFWQIVRFTGVGILLGWILNSWM